MWGRFTKRNAAVRLHKRLYSSVGELLPHASRILEAADPELAAQMHVGVSEGSVTDCPEAATACSFLYVR